MPSEKKRVNLTIPDDVYGRLQLYKQRHGIVNDATACYQLIVQQLTAQENGETFLKFMQACPAELLVEMTEHAINDAKQLPPSVKAGLSDAGLLDMVGAAKRRG